jgi:hypothetical protein
MPEPEPSHPAEQARVERGFAWPAWLLRVRDTTWRVIVSTVGASMRHRVTGLAA